MHRTMTILLFSKIFLIISLECEEIIMGGDFNLVMDVQRDKKEETRQRIEIRFKKSRTLRTRWTW